jgi:hypothetical protein
MTGQVRRRRYRPQKSFLVLAGLAMTCAAVGWADGVVRGDAGLLTMRLLVAGLIVGLAAVVLWRIARMGTVVRSDHVELRDLWSTVRVPWCDVKRIGVTRAPKLDITEGGPREYAWLYDRAGRRFDLLCVNDKDLGRRRNLQDEVEAIRATWRTGLRCGHDNWSRIRLNLSHRCRCRDCAAIVHISND